jgi:hypothetical protein
MRKAVTSAAALLAIVAASTAASTASAETSDYGATIDATFGANLDSQLPVTLDLPAPGAGVRIASVGFRWRRTMPTYSGVDYTTTAVRTPECAVGQPCQVETTLATGRFDESSGTIGIFVLDEDGAQIGSTSTALPAIHNPKPSVTLTGPHTTPAVWGVTSLTADAVLGDGGAALKGVRFYVNPTGREDDPYLFDDTAPYAVDVDGLDIADAGRQGTLYVVAEDMAGNLSEWTTVTPRPFTHQVTVGPPADMAFTSPAPNQPAGGMSTNARFEWSASVSDLTPATDNPLTDPYIQRVEILLDGQPWGEERDDQNPAWANYRSNSHMRSVSDTWTWTPAYGLSPGSHLATLRVTTSYGSVGTQDLPFVVTDGVKFSPITTADGRTVQDGFVVTAGSTTRLKVAVSGKVAGSHVIFGRMLDEVGGVIAGGDGWCAEVDWLNCPGRLTLLGDFWAPGEPGDYRIRVIGQESMDSSRQTITRLIHVQPASHLVTRAGSGPVTPGAPVNVSGRLWRVDTDTGRSGVPVTLQWRAAGTTNWRDQATTISGRRGQVSASSAHRVTGWYRWVTEGLPGKLGPSKGNAVRVYVAPN